MQEAAAQLAPALATFAATLLMVALTMATEALRKKLHSERANAVLDRLDKVVEDVVLEAEQCAVRVAKEKSEDGLLTADEARDIAAEVLSKAKLHLGKAGVREALSALGKGESELDLLLKSKIEATVAANKG